MTVTETTTGPIHVTKRGRVLEVRIERGKANALDKIIPTHIIMLAGILMNDAIPSHESHVASVCANRQPLHSLTGG